MDQKWNRDFDSTGGRAPQDRKDERASHEDEPWPAGHPDVVTPADVDPEDDGPPVTAPPS